MPRKRRVGLAISLLLGCGLLLTSCSSSAGQGGAAKSFDTPLHAVYSWFTSINQRQKSEMTAHAAPSAQSMMDWNDGVTSMWPSFSHVSCKVTNSTTSVSNLLCTFNETAPPGQQIDTFWTVSMERSTSGKWLITNYGQG